MLKPDLPPHTPKLYLMTYSGDMWSFPEIKWPVEAYREDIIQLGSDALNYPNWWN